MDPWLTQTKKTCPVCKQRVIRSAEDSDSEAEEGADQPPPPREEEEEEQDSERTPLLRASPPTVFGSTAQSPLPCLGEEEEQGPHTQSGDAPPGAPLLV